ncbi:MAG: ABC transporter ATP-binding protein [Microlunatus sp.]|nr:ABC transporter ATP-binding protein [Microlunatus sp.]
MSSPALQVSDLGVQFSGRPVLHDLSLQAAVDQLTGILGPNGAGKTTLMRVCAGLIRPVHGSVTVLGHRPGSPEAAARIGMMPQSTGAWSGIRPLELLRYLASLYAHPLEVDALAERLGLHPLAKTTYRRLSGGQQQAVNLAGALIGRPELVFLDEPTAGMDPHARRATWELLAELRAAGVSIVLTTHSMDEAAALSDLIHIVDRGQVSISGTVAELTAGGDSLEDVFLANTHASIG